MDPMKPQDPTQPVVPMGDTPTPPVVDVPTPMGDTPTPPVAEPTVPVVEPTVPADMPVDPTNKMPGQA